MSNLFNVPVKDGIGIYTITNQQSGKKYIGSSSELLARARLHKNGILRKYHRNKDILEDAIKGCDFRFEIVKIIDGSDCTSFDELRNKMLLEEYRMIKEAILNSEKHILKTLEKSGKKLPKSVCRELLDKGISIT